MTVPDNNVCSFCGLSLGGSTANGLCPHHAMVGDDWHIANKIFCDWLHRGIEPKRLDPKDRGDEDFWTIGEATGMAA